MWSFYTTGRILASVKTSPKLAAPHINRQRSSAAFLCPATAESCPPRLDYLREPRASIGRGKNSDKTAGPVDRLRCLVGIPAAAVLTGVQISPPSTHPATRESPGHVGWCGHARWCCPTCEVPSQPSPPPQQHDTAETALTDGRRACKNVLQHVIYRGSSVQDAQRNLLLRTAATHTR